MKRIKPIIPEPVETPRCGTCKYWFRYWKTRFENGYDYRACNHPSLGRVGMAPLKRATDGCKKHVERAKSPCG